jgi:aspartate aminotransferase
MMVSFSSFAASLSSETAFDVLAVARRLRAGGKDVIELQIGDSPFATPAHAKAAGIRGIEENQTHYGPSLGLPEFRAAIATRYTAEFGVPVTADNVVVSSGAKPFEQFFCEAFVEPGDSVLVFTPHFPTYEPNIRRRGANPVFSPLRAENQFRPDLGAVERFLRETPRARAIFLNSPHNPTGGVATRDDLRRLAGLIRGKDVAVFSDEPYCHMVWRGRHDTLMAEDGMLEQCVAAYTFSKSYSMSGWRLGYAVTHPEVAAMIGKMINTTLSCTPPFVQQAGLAGLRHDIAERDAMMAKFRRKVELLVRELKAVPEVEVEMPAGTFYVFPDVSAICRRLGIRSHGLAMYLLEGADDRRGVACLGGECFGPAGAGFLRFSCAEPDDRLVEAVHFFREAVMRIDRVAAFLSANPAYREGEAPAEPGTAGSAGASPSHRSLRK